MLIKGVERPNGLLTNIKCGCGCNYYIIHSFNRISRNQPPPKYLWGHFGIKNLKKYRFKKGLIPHNKGKHHTPETCEKIRKSKKGKVHSGMFTKGHTRNVGKKYKKRDLKE
jgi:hypothetical protein